MGRKSGFTLVEVLVYSAIFAGAAGVFLGVFTLVSRVQNRETLGVELDRQLQLTTQSIQRLVRGSSVIEMPSGIATSTLRLRMSSSTIDPTLIYLSNNAIFLEQGSGSSTPLTNDKVNVSTLNFQKFINSAGHDAVQLTLSATYSSTNMTEPISRTVQLSIVRVSSVNFTSDIVPAADNAYSVGSPNSRWKNVSLSGNFIAGTSMSLGTTTAIDPLLIAVSSTMALRVDSSGRTYVGGLLNLLSASSDFAGVTNGVLYYNSSSGKIRSYQNNAWTDFIPTSFVADPWGLNGSNIFANQPNAQNAKVGIGISSTLAGDKLRVNGSLYSASGGFEFSDGLTISTGRNTIVSSGTSDTGLVNAGYSYQGLAFTMPSLSAASWTIATASAGWSSRSAHASLVYNNNMWVLGGLNSTNVSLNDVWSSADGVNWTQATAAAQWPVRSAAGALSYNGLMWIMGGAKEDTFYNDVWSSSDGITWTQATAAAQWSQRSNFSVLVYNNLMWVIGGLDLHGNPVNDVWYSSDGVAWTRATSAAQWTARSGHTSVVFNGYMWVAGGTDANGATNDVWYSSDGVTWTRSTNAAAWSKRKYHASVVQNNKMWVMGGLNSTNTPLNDVWSSADGVSWSQATASAQWSARGNYTSFTYGNRMWVAGGNGGSVLNDVWYAYDQPAVNYYWYQK